MKIWTPKLLAVFAMLLSLALYRQCSTGECKCAEMGVHHQ